MGAELLPFPFFRLSVGGESSDNNAFQVESTVISFFSYIKLCESRVVVLSKAGVVVCTSALDNTRRGVHYTNTVSLHLRHTLVGGGGGGGGGIRRVTGLAQMNPSRDLPGSRTWRLLYYPRVV